MRKITTLVCILMVLFSNMTSFYAADEAESNNDQTVIGDGEVIRDLTDEEIESQQKEMMDIYEKADKEDEKNIIDVLEKDNDKKEENLNPRELEAVELMKALGVIPTDSELSHKLTRAEFAAAVYGISGYSHSSQSAVGTFKDVDKKTKYYSEISVLKDAGVIEGYPGGNFNPDKEINLEEASKMLIHVIGFDWQVKNDTNYYSVAADKKFFSGISDLNYDSITYKQTALALLNLLETDVGNNSTYNIEGLYMNSVLNIGKIEGVFEDDGKFSKVKKVTIDSQIFETADKDFSEFLFQKVRAYYHSKDNVNTLLSMTAYKKQNIIRIYDTEITDYSGRTYEYEIKGATRTKKAELEISFDFIYNGVKVTTGSTNNLMIPKSGYVELLDYEDNGKFDTVIVWDYEPFVVDSYNKNDMVLNSMNGKKKISLDDIPYDIFMSGSENRLSTDNIAYSGYVLSVARSIGGEYVKIYLCQQITARATAVYDDGAVVDGKDYSVFEGLNIKVGDSGVFHINNHGMIMHLEIGNSESEKYGYVIRKYINDEDDCVYIKLFSQDSENINAKISENVSIDARKPKGKDAILAASNGIDGTIVKFKINKDNEIIFIDTANYNSAESNSLNKTYEATSNIGFNSMLMALADNSYGVGKCPVTLDTIVFCVSEPYEEGQIWVYDMTQYTKKYATGYQVNLGELIVYNNDIESNVGDVILNKRSWAGENYTYSASNIKSGAIITKIVHSISDDDEICYELTAQRGALKEQIKLETGAMKFEDGMYTLSKGDIIRWRTDESGVVPEDGVTVIYDCDRKWFNYSDGSTSYAKPMTNEAGRWHRMWAYKRDGDHLISYNQDLSPKETFDESAISDYEDYKYIDYTRDVSSYKTRVYVFDTSANLLYEGSLADISTYKNEGASCSEFFGFTSTGHRFFIVYR